MPTSYLNTGILGQVAGGTLGVAGLASEFRELRQKVARKKRTVSGISREEREAQRKLREQRLAEAEATTGVQVDTSDVRPPPIPVDAEAPPAVQQQQQARNEEVAQKTITKAPVAATPPVAPPKAAVAPERQYTDADVAFARSFDAFYQNISTKGASDVRSGRDTLQSQLSDVIKAATSTGRKDVLSAVSGIQGILGQKHISAKNVGQAKGSTTSARSAIRNVLDLESILRENPLAPVAAPSAPTSPTSLLNRGLSQVASNRRRRFSPV